MLKGVRNRPPAPPLTDVVSTVGTTATAEPFLWKFQTSNDLELRHVVLLATSGPALTKEASKVPLMHRGKPPESGHLSLGQVPLIESDSSC